jgi:hypothetical protein
LNFAGRPRDPRGITTARKFALIGQLGPNRRLLRGSCACFCNVQNIQTKAAPRQTTVPKNINVI